MVFDERMDGLPEDGGAAAAGEVASEAESEGTFRRSAFNAQCALRLNVGEFAERVGGAIGDELAEINVGDVAATLGFVHVVSGDEEGDAVTGKLEEEIPELAARDGVDAGRWLVEEKKRRLVQHGAAEGEALLPAAGKVRGQAVEIGVQAIELDDFIDAALQACRVEAVNPAVKLQVFCDCEVVIEAEILRHVADAFADGFGIGADVKAFDAAGTAAERQEAGRHFDDGGFSAPVRPEHTENLAV